MLAADVPLGVLHSTWSCGVLLCNGWRHEKNSDMNISLILRTVDIAHQILEQRGVLHLDHASQLEDLTDSRKMLLGKKYPGLKRKVRCSIHGPPKTASRKC